MQAKTNYLSPQCQSILLQTEGVIAQSNFNHNLGNPGFNRYDDNEITI